MARNPQFENSNDDGGCCGAFGCLFLGLIPVASGIFVATRLAAYKGGVLVEMGSDESSAWPVATGGICTVVTLALIILAIFGRQPWFDARLGGDMARGAIADDDPDDDVYDTRWKDIKRTIPIMGGLAVGIPIAFAIGGGIPWLGIFGLAPAIAVILGIGALIYYLIGDIDRDR